MNPNQPTSQKANRSKSKDFFLQEAVNLEPSSVSPQSLHSPIENRFDKGLGNLDYQNIIN